MLPCHHFTRLITPFGGPILDGLPGSRRVPLCTTPLAAACVCALLSLSLGPLLHPAPCPLPHTLSPSKREDNPTKDCFSLSRCPSMPRCLQRTPRLLSPAPLRLYSGKLPPQLAPAPGMPSSFSRFPAVRGCAPTLPRASEEARRPVPIAPRAPHCRTETAAFVARFVPRPLQLSSDRQARSTCLFLYALYMLPIMQWHSLTIRIWGGRGRGGGGVAALIWRSQAGLEWGSLGM